MPTTTIYDLSDCGCCTPEYCGCADIPDTLNYTLTGCFSNSGTLTHSMVGSIHRWRDETGFACGGSGNLYPKIQCISGTGWVFTLDDDAGAPLAACVGWSDNSPLVTCSPFELDAIGSPATGCPCCMGGGSIAINVTE